MTRQIKFRAWNPVDMEMIADPLVYDDVGINDNFENFEDDEYYLMQYTGLKDKNGKSIFEGDVIRLEDVQAIITFDDGAFQMITSKHQGRSQAIQNRTKRFEIIGNIYENPNLLEAE